MWRIIVRDRVRNQPGDGRSARIHSGFFAARIALPAHLSGVLHSLGLTHFPNSRHPYHHSSIAKSPMPQTIDRAIIFYPATYPSSLSQALSHARRHRSDHISYYVRRYRISSPFISSTYISFHWTSFHWTSLRRPPFHWTSFHWTSLRRPPFHWI